MNTTDFKQVQLTQAKIIALDATLSLFNQLAQQALVSQSSPRGLPIAISAPAQPPQQVAAQAPRPQPTRRDHLPAPRRAPGSPKKQANKRLQPPQPQVPPPVKARQDNPVAKYARLRTQQVKGARTGRMPPQTKPTRPAVEPLKPAEKAMPAFAPIVRSDPRTEAHARAPLEPTAKRRPAEPAGQPRRPAEPAGQPPTKSRAVQPAWAPPIELRMKDEDNIELQDLIQSWHGNEEMENVLLNQLKNYHVMREDTNLETMTHKSTSTSQRPDRSTARPYWQGAHKQRGGHGKRGCKRRAGEA